MWGLGLLGVKTELVLNICILTSLCGRHKRGGGGEQEKKRKMVRDWEGEGNPIKLTVINCQYSH